MCVMKNNRLKREKDRKVYSLSILYVFYMLLYSICILYVFYMYSINIWILILLIFQNIVFYVYSDIIPKYSIPLAF